LHGESETKAARAGDEAVEPVLRLGDVASVDERLENAVDAGLGDASLLVDIFERDGGVVLFEKLDNVEGLGEDGDEVEPLDLGFWQGGLRRTSNGVEFSIQNIHTEGARVQGPGFRSLL
jgi:hypothetical protein